MPESREEVICTEETAEDFLVRRADLEREDDLEILPARCTYALANIEEVLDFMMESSIKTELGLQFGSDVLVWQVAVLAGEELQVACTIRTLCDSTSMFQGILAADAVKHLRGYIYVLASEDASLEQLHQRVAYIKRSPPPKIVDLLTGREDTRRNLTHTWVRITEPGVYATYCGDLAWVEEMNMETMTTTIMVVPRLPRMTDAGDARPRRALLFSRDLFSACDMRPLDCEVLVGPQDTFDFRGQHFRGGLLVLEGISCYSISEEYVNPGQDEVYLFRQSTIENRNMFPMPESPNRLQLAEHVRIIAGEWKYLGAVVHSWSDTGDLLVNLSDPESHMPATPISLRAQDVVPDLKNNDRVEIIQGRHVGYSGYVESIDWIGGTAEVKQRRTPLLYLEDDGKPAEALLRLDEEACAEAFTAELLQLRIIDREKAPSTSCPTITEAHPSNVKKYDGTEVKLLKGNWKGYYGTIVATTPEMDFVDVLLEGTALVGVKTRLRINEVRERFTYTKLEIASQLPPVTYRSIRRLNEQRTKSTWQAILPSLRPVETDVDVETLEKATWPETLPDERSTTEISPPPPRYSGHWLSDPRLLLTRLDVRIRAIPSYHGGKYEGATGFIRPQDRTAVPKNRGVKALIGRRHRILMVQYQFILPLTTTERDGDVAADVAQPVLATPGCRVVIIGDDLDGCDDYVGYVGEVVDGDGPTGLVRLLAEEEEPKNRDPPLKGLPLGEVLRRFPESSVCRSSNRTGY
ncbi:hypothetical protein C8R44DRAFT_792389 [Mycena epipterygia]|nr:hypothetical protein C8R44DRAFT_792389 [Mycena epipterygia]